MSPVVFEAIMFLKENNTYGNENFVKESMAMVRSSKVTREIKEYEEYIEN